MSDQDPIFRWVRRIVAHGSQTRMAWVLERASRDYRLPPGMTPVYEVAGYVLTDAWPYTAHLRLLSKAQPLGSG